MKVSLSNIRKKQAVVFITVFALSLIILQALITFSNDQFVKADSTTNPWSTFRNGPTHLGVSNASGPTASPTMRWHFLANTSVVSSPAVVNGKVYFGTAIGYVYCLNETNGNILWRSLTNSSIRGSPAVGNGLVYVGSNDGAFYAFNDTTGSRVWYQITGPIRSSATIVGSTVYVASSSTATASGAVYAFNANSGALVWSLFLSTSTNAGMWTSSPAVSGNRLYIGTSASPVVTLVDTATGNPSGAYATGGGVVLSSPAISNGRLFAGADDGKIYAFNATGSTGEIYWSYTTGNAVQSSPAVYGGRIYVGSNDSNVYALDATTGALAWTYTARQSVFSSPIVANGVIYVGSNDGDLYALNAGTGARIWNYSTGGIVQSSPAVTDGTVFFATTIGDVYAITGTTDPLPTPTPFPTPTPTPVISTPTPYTSTPIPPSTPTPTPTPTPTQTPTPPPTPTPTPSPHPIPTPTPIGPNDFSSWLSVRPVSAAEVASASTITILAAAIATFTTISINYVSSSSAEAIATMPFPDWLKEFLKKYTESKFEDKVKKYSNKPKTFAFVSPKELGVLAVSIALAAFVAAFVKSGGIANLANFTNFSNFLLAALISAVIVQTATFACEAYAAYAAGVKKQYTLWNIGSVMFLVTGFIFMFPFSSLTTTNYAEKLPHKVKGISVLLKKLMLLTLTILFGFFAVSNFANLGIIGDTGLLLVLTSICSALIPLTPLAGKEILKYKKTVLAAFLVPIALMLFCYQIQLFPLWVYSLIGITALFISPVVLNRLKTQKATEKIRQQQEDQYFKQNLL